MAPPVVFFHSSFGFKVGEYFSDISAVFSQFTLEQCQYQSLNLISVISTNLKISQDHVLSMSSCVSPSVFASVAEFWAHMTFIRPPGGAEHLPHPAMCVMRNMVLIPFSYSQHQTLSLAKYFAEAR